MLFAFLLGYLLNPSNIGYTLQFAQPIGEKLGSMLYNCCRKKKKVHYVKSYDEIFTPTEQKEPEDQKEPTEGQKESTEGQKEEPESKEEAPPAEHDTLEKQATEFLKQIDDEMTYDNSQMVDTNSLLDDSNLDQHWVITRKLTDS